jgi:hypothetical protein
MNYSVIFTTTYPTLLYCFYWYSNNQSAHLLERLSSTLIWLLSARLTLLAFLFQTSGPNINVGWWSFSTLLLRCCHHHQGICLCSMIAPLSSSLLTLSPMIVDAPTLHHLGCNDNIAMKQRWSQQCQRRRMRWHVNWAKWEAWNWEQRAPSYAKASRMHAIERVQRGT